MVKLWFVVRQSEGRGRAHPSLIEAFVLLRKLAVELEEVGND